MFQSTRPQGARPIVPTAGLWLALRFNPRVSIHAPARGATVYNTVMDDDAKKFQSTRPQGARHFRGLDFAPLRGFNPRARKGRDSVGRAEIEAKHGFQSTRPQGARLLCEAFAEGNEGFNPRARKGRDRRTANGYVTLVSFNPRARKGRDPFATTRRKSQSTVSIHAPARGATDSVSIHAPARGATFLMVLSSHSCEFQSTRPQGARPLLAFRSTQ